MIHLELSIDNMEIIKNSFLSMLPAELPKHNILFGQHSSLIRVMEHLPQVGKIIAASSVANIEDCIV